MRWLTPRAYRRWRDIGLGGYGADGLRCASWRGRNDVRNTSFSDLLWTSGLRVREGATLLAWEVPAAGGGDKYVRGRVSAAVAKGGAGRDFWVSERALRAVAAYHDSTRAAAIRRAQQAGRYAGIDGMMVALRATGDRKVVLVGDDGETHRMSLDALGPKDRQRLFVRGPTGLEPAQMWLTEAGMPMPYRTWQRVFEVANSRCQRLGVDIRCTPHMLRHSVALRVLVALLYAYDRRLGLTPRQREEYRIMFGDPYVAVQTLLGHRSRATTEDIYLEPARGLDLERFLNDDDEGLQSAGALLSQIVEASGLVVDDPQ